MSYSAFLLLAQFSILSTLSGGGHLTTAVPVLLALSCMTVRAVDWIASFQVGKNAMLGTSIVLNSSTISHLALIAIEDLSTAFRTLSLGFRYAANSTAGHILLHIVASLLITSSIAVVFSTLAYLGLVLFEYAVAVIQVCIYAVLISTYAGF
jgi:F0F1-type ATP synthase membrane subunit a